jgi:hypothetical protein
MLLAIPLSCALAAALFSAWVRVGGGEFAVTITPAALPLYVLAVVVTLAAHEVLHAFALPSAGLGAATIIGFWPSTCTPYVAFEGELPRNRSIVVALVPLLVLSVVPLLLGFLFSIAPPWMVLVSVLNGFGASGDLIGALLLARGVPASGVVRNSGISTWWRAEVL